MIEKEVLQNLLSNEFRVLRKRGRKVRIKWIDWLDHCFVRGVSVSMDTLGGIDPAPWLAWVAWRKSGRRIGSTIYLCLGYQDALRGDVDLLKDVLRHEFRLEGMMNRSYSSDSVRSTMYRLGPIILSGNITRVKMDIPSIFRNSVKNSNNGI